MAVVSREVGVTEVIWGGGNDGTGVTSEGARIALGREGRCAGEHLLTLAVQQSLMATFLERAASAGTVVLGYVSTARVEPDDRAGLHGQIVVSSCVVTEADASTVKVRELFGEALARCPLGRLLRQSVTAHVDVQRV